MKKLYKDQGKAKSFLYYYGWTILVFLLAFFFIFFFIFQAIFYVKRTERIDLFIAAYGLKDYQYASKIEKQFKDSGLIEMNIYSYMEDDINVYDYFTANGEKADFIIFSETNVHDLEDYVTYNYFPLSSLEGEVEVIKEFETYKYNEVSYGIKIYDKDNQSYNNRFKFSDFIEFNKEGKTPESYYLLVDNESPNFDKDKGHTLGFLVLDYILKDMII